MIMPRNATHSALLLSLLLVTVSLAARTTTVVHEVSHFGEQTFLGTDMADSENKVLVSDAEQVEYTAFAFEDDEEEYDEEDEEYEEYDDEEEYDEEEEEISEASYDNTASPAASAVDIYGSDFGEPQVIDTEHADAIHTLIKEARVYIRDTVMVDDKYVKVRDQCRNKHRDCTFWAALGECENNPSYMTLNCAPVCFSCDLLHIESRCPMPADDSGDAFRPGELDQMFERILTDPYYQQFEPKAISRPTLAPGDTNETADYVVGGPWMVIFDKAVSDEEADRLIELGAMEGYKRSEDVGEELPDGTYTSVQNSGRTSTNAWCNDVCYQDPIAKNVMERISNITGTPEVNSEYLQLLRYEKTQFYQTHSDYIEYQAERPTGVRVGVVPRSKTFGAHVLSAQFLNLVVFRSTGIDLLYLLE